MVVAAGLESEDGRTKRKTQAEKKNKLEDHLGGDSAVLRPDC